MIKPELLYFHEQQNPDSNQGELVQKVINLTKQEDSSLRFEGNPEKYMGIPKYLGIGPDLKASYYIGTSWLVKNELAAVVTPKLDNLDYVSMFVTALSVSSQAEQNYFSDCYGIDFNKPSIQLPESLNQLTPLLVIHYLSLIETVIRKGLKKGYVYREENLNSKIRGKIKVSSNIHENILKNRYDKNYCSFNEYTTDIPENRLLKKALNFSLKILTSTGISNHKHGVTLIQKTNRYLQYFSGVSDEIRVGEIKNLGSNKIFYYYADAIEVGKQILRQFDYSIDNVNSENKTYPFWIDMSRLFELFVFSKLNEAYKDSIYFQVKGYQKTCVDYLKIDDSERIIIDAKYKPRYDGSNAGMLDDIREISGYARDEIILGKLGYEEDIVPKCLIIYPEKNKVDDEDDDCNEYEVIDSSRTLIEQSSRIKSFRQFYKMSIRLPERI